MAMHAQSVKKSSHRWRRSFVIVSLIIVLLVPFTGLAAAQHNSSDMVAQAVDIVRTVVGPRPIAVIEQTVFSVQDWFNLISYQFTGNSFPGWRLTHQAVNSPTDFYKTNGCSGVTLVKNSAPSFNPPTALTPLISYWTLPGEGQWRPLMTAGQPAHQPPILWRTVYRPDPSRPFVRVALVAMDTSRSRLHMMIGVKEPKSRPKNHAPRPGMLPPEVQNSGALLAAWNGGFKAVHGHYGMMSDGVTWLPPKRGMATLAIQKDGKVLIGAWGHGRIPNPDMIAWRQNNPPLIEQGVVNPDVNSIANDRKWGATITKMAYTWRSGLGLSRDNRWLIYAAGNSLTTSTLTKALQAAGAYNAMQTDINQPFIRFETYEASPQIVKIGSHTVTLSLIAHPLIDKMNGGSYQFLIPYKRDFFYLTSLSGTRKTSSNPSLAQLWHKSNLTRMP